MSLPKTRKECTERLIKAREQIQEYRQHQVELGLEFAEFAQLNSDIMTDENFSMLSSVVALAGKEAIPTLIKAAKENPTKEVIQRTSKLSFLCLLYASSMAWLFNQMAAVFKDESKYEPK